MYTRLRDMTGPLPAKWVNDLIRRVPKEDRGKVLTALQKIADDLLRYEPQYTLNDLREVITWIAAAEDKVEVDTEGNGGHMVIYRVDDDQGPHSALAIVYVVQGQLDYAVTLLFDLYP